MRFVLNSGQLVSPVWKEMQSIEDIQKFAAMETFTGVKLEMQSGTA